MPKKSPLPAEAEHAEKPISAPALEHEHEAHIVTLGEPSTISGHCLTCGAIAKAIDAEQGIVTAWEN